MNSFDRDIIARSIFDIYGLHLLVKLQHGLFITYINAILSHNSYTDYF